MAEGAAADGSLGEKAAAATGSEGFGGPSMPASALPSSTGSSSSGSSKSSSSSSGRGGPITSAAAAAAAAAAGLGGPSGGEVPVALGALRSVERCEEASCRQRTKEESLLRRMRGVRGAEPPDRTELGNSSWALLHRAAAVFPKQPTQEETVRMDSWLTAFFRLYPCTECREHLRPFVEGNPPKSQSNRQLSSWMCVFHNYVNADLEKDLLLPCDGAALQAEYAGSLTRLFPGAHENRRRQKGKSKLIARVRRTKEEGEEEDRDTQKKKWLPPLSFCISAPPFSLCRAASNGLIRKKQKLEKSKLAAVSATAQKKKALRLNKPREWKVKGSKKQKSCQLKNG
ncbi:hypothetical protein Efla_004382 [Eimeria flavescens]